eukprot:m.1046629 g.1046629  ORF g.1046629 m.1046629 type:complete len:89 (+) comp24170_c0_seq132:1111-1377(+)
MQPFTSCSAASVGDAHPLLPEDADDGAAFAADDYDDGDDFGPDEDDDMAPNDGAGDVTLCVGQAPATPAARQGTHPEPSKRAGRCRQQ